MQVISYYFFLGIRLSGLTISLVTDKRESSVGILDFNNIYVSAYGSNWLIKFDVLVTFCVLVDSLVILYCSGIGATKLSFFNSILLLGDSKLLVAYSSSKSFLDFLLIFGVNESLHAFSYSSFVILVLPMTTCSLISSKVPLPFSASSLGENFSLGDTCFFGDGPMILDDVMILCLILSRKIIDSRHRSST